jgi:hypothetical protein
MAGKLACLCGVLVGVFSLESPAYADPIKYAIVNATLADGGTATGYVLYETPPAPEPPRATDWAITATAGTTITWGFVYDPTNSTVSITADLMTFVGPAFTAPACGGQPRRIQFDLLQFGPLAAETCLATRPFVSGDFEPLPGPFLTLKANNQHPASRVVFGGGGVNLTLDISPAGWTTPLDWYFAIVFAGNVYWATPGGISLVPAPLARLAPVLASNVPVLSAPLNGNTETTFVIIATDGSSMIAYDYITMVVPPSP